MRRVLRGRPDAKSYWIVALTLARGQKVVIPNKINKAQCLIAAEALMSCAVPNSALWKQARFLRDVILRGGPLFFPASARTTLANYRKTLKKWGEQI